MIRLLKALTSDSLELVDLAGLASIELFLEASWLKIDLRSYFGSTLGWSSKFFFLRTLTTFVFIEVLLSMDYIEVVTTAVELLLL